MCSFRAMLSFPEAKVRWPSHPQMVQFAAVIEARNAHVGSGTFAFVDGFTVKIPSPSDASIQNAMHSGWKHMTLVSSVILSTPGTLRSAVTSLVTKVVCRRNHSVGGRQLSWDVAWLQCRYVAFHHIGEQCSLPTRNVGSGWLSLSPDARTM